MQIREKANSILIEGVKNSFVYVRIILETDTQNNLVIISQAWNLINTKIKHTE